MVLFLLSFKGITNPYLVKTKTVLTKKKQFLWVENTGLTQNEISRALNIASDKNTIEIFVKLDI